MKTIKIITDTFKAFEMNILEMFFYGYVEDYQIKMDADITSTYPVEIILKYQDNEICNRVMNETLKLYRIIHYEFI